MNLLVTVIFRFKRTIYRYTNIIRLMLIQFFQTLRAAKLPVSVREFLTLLEGLEKGVIGGREGEPPPSIDDVPITELSYDDRRVLLQHAVLLSGPDRLRAIGRSSVGAPCDVR